MKCKECGAKIIDDMMFCGSCGTEVSETSGTAKQRFCRDCGLQISPERYTSHRGLCGPCMQKTRRTAINGYFLLLQAIVVTGVGLWLLLDPTWSWGFPFPIGLLPLIVGIGWLTGAIVCIIRGRRLRRN